MNGREIAKELCEWIDNKKIDKRDFERMSIADLMKLLMSEKK